MLVFTAGTEARNTIVGSRITATSTVDGFSGDWKVTEVSRSLTDVQITCIRYNADAYGDVTGVTSSSKPLETNDTRTPPGPGPNLLLNPALAPPPTPLSNIEFSDVIGGPSSRDSMSTATS